MAELNLNFYTNVDHYSDGDIEEKMLEMANNGMGLEDLEGKVEFPVFYHFSDIRKNILCWYPFNKNDAILEIGSGCGAITGLLCEKAGRVTSVELSRRRAEINYGRNKDKENLTIMVGNLNDMDLEQSYDYVVVNGVLEYAMSFTEGRTPYETFLKNMGAYLKDTGKIIIAIENRLGLKYFSGAPEDHTDLHFYGLNGYPDNHSVRTFSKKKMTGLLNASGFPYQEFYYPYPDYKFPKEIYSEKGLRLFFAGKNSPAYTDKVVELFNEKEVGKTLAREDIMDRFMNSFLVVAGKQEIIKDSDILYAKINRERKTQFQLMTTIIEKDGERVVRKTALNDQAVPFLKKMALIEDEENAGDYSYLKCEYKDKYIQYPFLYGETVNDEISKWVEEGSLDKIENELQKILDHYLKNRKTVENYQTEEFCKVFGDYPGKKEYECICPANIDVICNNIIKDNGKYEIIDYEWVFPFDVPVLFIFWRMLHELFTNVSGLSRMCSEEDMMRKFGIDYSDMEIFMNWAVHFVYGFCGSDSSDKYMNPKIQIPLTDYVNEKLNREKICSKLYYDQGRELSEDNVIIQETELDGDKFTVRYDLSMIDGIRGLRWNPNFGYMCSIAIDRIDSEEKVEMLPSGPHIVKDDDTTIFLTKNPRYFLRAWKPEQIKYLTIEGRYHILSDDEMHMEFENEYQLAMEKKKAEEEAEKETVPEKDAEEDQDEMINEETNDKESEVEVKDLQEQEVEEMGKSNCNDNILKPEKSIFCRVKNKIKRIVRGGEKADAECNGTAQNEPEAQPAPEKQQSVGFVDKLFFENGYLDLVGWAFDYEYPMKNKRVVFYDEETRIYDGRIQVIARKDVAGFLQNENADMCGYSFTAQVNTPKDIQAFLEYDTPEGGRKISLGTITKNNDSCSEISIIPIEEDNCLGDIKFYKKTNVFTYDYSCPEDVLKEKIDIIIPVYNGIQYFDSLFSGIEKTKMKYRLILIDDNSPDPAVTEYLDRYNEEHEEVLLIRNEKNLGFVQSVNKGLSIAENHVALVNTDVEVPAEWLERLMQPIIQDDKTATTTPFTTCGTICSFPDFCKDNPIFQGLNVWQVDDVFRRINPQFPVMPTGVGFCMGMNIHVIKEIGVLDADSFGKGYCEENDWCQRAAEAGYKNVHVENLFVYHKHGGSFPSEQKMKLLEENQKKLLAKHPEYNAQVASYCEIDPAKKSRLYAQLRLLNKYGKMPVIVAFDHNLGGGATEYLIEKTKLALKDGKCFITVRYDLAADRYQVTYQYEKYMVKYYASDLDLVFGEIQRVDEIWINELVTYQNIFKVQDKILELKAKYNARLKMLLHDFFCVCPAVNLMDHEGKYCHVASCEVCSQCIPQNESNACLDYESGDAWRKHWGVFLGQCEEITAFSDDSVHLFKKAYPNIFRIKVIPHKPHYMTALNKKAKTTKTLNIGLLGVLCYKKGLQVVKDMVSYIEAENLNVRMKLIGIADEEIDSPVFSSTGRYTRGEIPGLTMKEDIDIFLIPSIWPETFSYTTSEIISMNMPIAVLPIGAPVDRVKKYEKGIVLSSDDPASMVKEISRFAEKVQEKEEIRVNEERFLFIAEEISFASRYRVEHFIEQLRYNGYDSDFIQMDERDTVSIEEYHAVILYRCSNVEGVKEITEKAGQAGIPVYFDIDDYIFDYDKIRYLDFLDGPDYTEFEQTTKNIHKCMEMADRYFTSTNTLADVIRGEFAGKQVVVNRNCSSMEMQILSHDAVEHVEKDKEKIQIGYFSGSKTHDNDFSIIEKVLFRLMEKYPQVQLKMVGVLSNSRWKKMESRIVRIPFMEWQKLPETYAGIDINLMPLEDTLFHCCKSENKWMEAALVKVPSVMSWNDEMKNVIISGEDGYLCRTEEEWENALEQLITDESRRRSVGQKAFEKVCRNYVTQTTGKEAREELLCHKGIMK